MDDAPDKPLLNSIFDAQMQDAVDASALLLHRMINRIRRSLELPKILNATVAEVRAFLATDRVKIYRFHKDGSGEVVAEAIHEQRLPSLLEHNFPAADIPPEARELFLKARIRSIVDVSAQQIGISSLEGDGAGGLGSDLRFRPADSCHIEYLTEMGVQSSLVVPILDGDDLWGLLVSHHSQPHRFTEQELQVVQLIADQVSVAIAQSNLLAQTRLQATQEAAINQIALLLHTLPEMQIQEALDHTINALRGTGGRLYIASQNQHHAPQIWTSGDQPTMPAAWEQTEPEAEAEQPESNAKNTKYIAMEQHPHWQIWLQMEEAIAPNQDMWAIADLYRAVMPSDLSVAFLSVQVRGLLIVRLQYRQHLIGYLSVFRREIDVERIWAGKIDQKDPRQMRPHLSFETWRELKQGLAVPWSAADLHLTNALADQFATAIHQNALYQQVCALNTHLKRDIYHRKQAEAKIAALNAELEQRVLERTAQLKHTNEELVKQVGKRDRALSELQQAQVSLARLSHQTELILNSAGEGIYGLNRQGKITFANPAAARMLGYEVAELKGQWMHSLLKHAKPDGTPYLATDSPIFSTLQAGTLQHQTEDRFYRQDGTDFPVEYVSSPIREEGKVVGAVVIFKDITTRQQVEQMQDEFVSVQQHGGQIWAESQSGQGSTFCFTLPVAKAPE